MILCKPHTMSTFTELGISDALLTNLGKGNFSVPTPIQEQAIPAIMAGKNYVGIAHTGTGKTLAFALPVIERLRANPGTALIMVPTRELALQMEKIFRKMCAGIPKMNPSLLISGVPMKRQLDSLKTRPRILIATPGRINEHLDARSLRLDDVSLVVLDEADRMLDSGFAPQIERILDRAPKNRQTLMFSATMSDLLTKLLQRYAPEADRVDIKDELHDMTLIAHQVCRIAAPRRTALLTKIIHNTTGPVLVFCASKRGAQALYDVLRETTLTVTCLHGERTPAARTEAIEGFRKGLYQVLVTTDVSARGIDVPTISLVINYDLPRDPETYVHRVGRTGRAGKSGRAITFVSPMQNEVFAAMEIDLGISLTLLPRETSPDQEPTGVDPE
jgi:superfamily II DNA/RNA helicase